MIQDARTCTVHILLVEDDEIDAEAIIRAFRRERIANPITVVRDGIEGLAALRGSEGHVRMPRPYLILLDLNMPRMNGIEFLHALRQDPELARSVVFVLTTSDRDEDKLAAYDRQVAGYILKTNAGEDFLELIALVRSYWRIVELPPDQASTDSPSSTHD